MSTSLTQSIHIHIHFTYTCMYTDADILTYTYIHFTCIHISHIYIYADILVVRTDKSAM